MTERGVDREVHDYVDGRMSEEGRARFELRLQEDPALAERVRSYREIGDALKALPADLPGGFHLRTAARLREAEVRRHPWRWAASWEAVGLAAAALVLAAILIPLVREHGFATPRPDTEMVPRLSEPGGRGAAPGSPGAAKADADRMRPPAREGAVGSGDLLPGLPEATRTGVDGSGHVAGDAGSTFPDRDAGEKIQTLPMSVPAPAAPAGEERAVEDTGKKAGPAARSATRAPREGAPGVPEEPAFAPAPAKTDEPARELEDEAEPERETLLSRQAAASPGSRTGDVGDRFARAEGARSFQAAEKSEPGTIEGPERFTRLRGARIPGSLLPAGTVLLVRDPESWRAIVARADEPVVGRLQPDLARETVVLVGERDPAIACDRVSGRQRGGTIELLVEEGGEAGGACALVVPGAPTGVEILIAAEGAR